MERGVVLQGILSDPTHIKLDQPVTGLHGTVEVILRPMHGADPPAADTDGQAWEAAFDAWVQGHDGGVPVPHADACLRETLYDDRL